MEPSTRQAASGPGVSVLGTTAGIAVSTRLSGGTVIAATHSPEYTRRPRASKPYCQVSMRIGSPEGFCTSRRTATSLESLPRSTTSTPVTRMTGGVVHAASSAGRARARNRRRTRVRSTPGE